MFLRTKKKFLIVLSVLLLLIGLFFVGQTVQAETCGDNGGDYGSGEWDELDFDDAACNSYSSVWMGYAPGSNSGDSSSDCWFDMCCGDDQGEYPIQQKCNTTAACTTLDYFGCCSEFDGCFWDGTCYSIATEMDLDSDGNTEYCMEGVWLDCIDSGDCASGETCTNNACVSSCACTSGACCDGCNYRISGTVCGYSAYNGCHSYNECMKKRDIYKCTGSSATCPTTDQGDDYTPVSTEGKVCSSGSEVAPSSGLYCDYLNSCTAGACSGTRYWRGCIANEGDPDICSTTNQTSSVIYASSGYSLTSSCTTGTSYCSDTDNCSGTTRYTGYKCNGSGSCNVSSGDIGCCAHSKCTVNGYPFCQYYNAGDENAKASPANDGDAQSGYVELASRYVCAPAKYLNRGTEAVSWDLGSLNTYYNRQQTYMSDANWWKFTGDGMVTAETSVTPSDTDLCFVYNYDPCTLSSDSDVVIRKTDGTLVDLGDIKQGLPITSGCSSNWIWIDLGSHVGIDPGILKIVLFSGNDDFVREWQFGWKKSETGNVTDGTNSTWCCDSSSDCVDDAPSQGNRVSGDPDSVCYNTGSTRDVDNDGDVDVCSSGSWIDCTSDSHCKNNFKCSASTCYSSSDSHCKNNFKSSASTCYSSCSSNSQCASGYHCSAPDCIPVLVNGLICDENSDCASGNCRKEIDSSNYYCAASGNLCSEGGAGNAGYAAGAVGTNNNASWMCSSQDVSYQCTLANTCKTYNSKYCNGAGVWNSGTGLNVPTTGCNSYTCDSHDIMQDVCNGSGSCSQQGKFIVDCNNNESNRCVNGQSTCQNLCSNSVDDDGDGYKDGQDTDCGGCSQCTSGTCCNTSTGCYYSSGTVCRTAADLCDLAENCTGSSSVCPTDALKSAGTVCRAVAGACDVAETCTGYSTSCPTNVYLSGKQSCGTCQYCNGSSATCQLMASGSDTYNDCGTTGCYTGNCNGSGACASYLSGQRNCGTCKQCNGSGVCVNVTDNTDPYNSCGTCKVCSGGACVNVANGEDSKDECAFENCRPGYCWEGTCAVYLEGCRGYCPECQVCDGSGTCISAERTLCDDFLIGDYPAVYCLDGDNRLCGSKQPGEVCCVEYQSTCFTGNTLIKMASGQDKKIGEIKIGDLIQGYNLEERSEKGVNVTDIFKHEKQKYYLINFEDGSILEVTKDHPLYTENGYLKVESLKAGDKVGRINSDKLEFIKITKIKKSLFRKPVYNLEVDEHHNYFANGFLAHNKAGICDTASDGSGTKVAQTCGDGVCKVCSNGSCVNVSSGQDIDFLDFCSDENCGKGYCDGGACSYYTDLEQHNCRDGLQCGEEGLCEEDPTYEGIVISPNSSFLAKGKNLIINEPLLISALDPQTFVVAGTENGNLSIQSDITIGSGAYLIWGKGKKVVLDGGGIIFDGGAIVRAGSEIKTGWAGPIGQTILGKSNEKGLTACICRLNNPNPEIKEELLYGVLPSSWGDKDSCDDPINPVYCGDNAEAVTDDLVGQEYGPAKIMPNGEFHNWKAEPRLRYTQELKDISTPPGEPPPRWWTSGLKSTAEEGWEWTTRLSDTSGWCKRFPGLFWRPDINAGYWKCSICNPVLWIFSVITGGSWESYTHENPDSPHGGWCPGSGVGPDGEDCPLYNNVVWQ